MSGGHTPILHRIHVHIHDALDQKIKFPTCPVFQNMTFPHISYTYLAEDRATFRANE